MAERAAETQSYIDNILGSEARTAPSLQLYVTKISDGIDIDGQRVLMGALQGYTRVQARGIFRRTELDSVVPGQAIVIIPLAVTAFTLVLHRVMLNESTMMQALGFRNIEDLMQANTPIILEELAYRKDSSGSTWSRVTRYHGCILKSNPLEVDLTGDWMLIQECEFEVAYSEVEPETRITR